MNLYLNLLVRYLDRAREGASIDDLKRTHSRSFEDLIGFLQPA